MPEFLLQTKELCAFYGELQVLTHIDVSLRPGQVLSIVGANGAGKSTFLKSLCGLMNQGAIARTTGNITFDGEPIQGQTPDAILRRGIALVPEGRRLFAGMTVEDNLLCGAYTIGSRAATRVALESIYSLFPRLKERRGQNVSLMSGGEQQMVAIGRALISSPKLVLFDELSLGLSPAAVDLIYERIADISKTSVTCIIVEQNLSRALAASSHTIVTREGEMILEGNPKALALEDIEAAYFGSEETHA